MRLFLFIPLAIMALISCNKDTDTSIPDTSLTSAAMIPVQEQSAMARLSVDSIYTTMEDKVRYEELKAKFLNIWLSDSNCYRGQAMIQKAWWKFYQDNLKEVNVSTILHSPNYDTLLVLVSWYAAEEEGAGAEKRAINGRTVSVGMGVITDAEGNWHFRCDGGTYWIHSEGNKLAENELLLKEAILKKDYFTAYQHPNPSFWKDLYADKRLLSKAN